MHHPALGGIELYGHVPEAHVAMHRPGRWYNYMQPALPRYYAPIRKRIPVHPGKLSELYTQPVLCELYIA